MNYLELYDQAMRDLDHDRISFDEFEKRIKPLKEEVRPTGHWVKQIEDNHDGDKYMCSCCGEIIRVKLVMGVPQYITCPMCGAKMESEGAE